MSFLQVAVSFVVIFTTTFGLTRWEKRTLLCDVDDCLLSIQDGKFLPAECVLTGRGQHRCNLKCEGADRDSVISKSPTTNRKCIRYYTYNAEQASEQWWMWRSQDCAQQHIQLEVHCGFPEDIVAHRVL